MSDRNDSEQRPADLRYDDDWSEPWAMTDGTRVVLRTVRPDDIDLLRAGFGQLSPDSRYLRFFNRDAKLSESALHYLCDVDGWDHFALGAVLADEPVGVGIARFVRDPEHPERAEPAVAVVDAFQGHGLGTALVLRLAAAARERGIEEFRFDILARNDRMRNLLDDVAPNVRFGFPQAGAMEVRVPLPDIEFEDLRVDTEPWRETDFHQLWVRFASEPGAILSRVLKRSDESE